MVSFILPTHNAYIESELATFPHSLWGVVESSENLTPRGLANTFASNDTGPFLNHSLDSFLLSRRRDDSEEELKAEKNNTSANSGNNSTTTA